MKKSHRGVMMIFLTHSTKMDPSNNFIWFKIRCFGIFIFCQRERISYYRFFQVKGQSECFDCSVADFAGKLSLIAEP